MSISLRLDFDLEQRLSFLSKETGRTKTFYIKKLIEENIEDLEDIYLSDAVMERIKSGEESTISLSELEKNLGLEH